MIDKKQSIKELTFVAFDIETTGLIPVVNRIVEIGAIKFTNKKIIDTFEELIDPKMPISPGATAVWAAAAPPTRRSRRQAGS